MQWPQPIRTAIWRASRGSGPRFCRCTKLTFLYGRSKTRTEIAIAGTVNTKSVVTVHRLPTIRQTTIHWFYIQTSDELCKKYKLYQLLNEQLYLKTEEDEINNNNNNNNNNLIAC